MAAKKRTARKTTKTPKPKLPPKLFATVKDGEPTGAWSKESVAKGRMVPGEVLGVYVLVERKRH
jgi:hypothetical protein